MSEKGKEQEIASQVCDNNIIGRILSSSDVYYNTRAGIVFIDLVASLSARVCHPWPTLSAN